MSALAKYAGRRLLIAAGQVVFIFVLVFFLIRLLPVDPVAQIVGGFASPQTYQHVKDSLNLNQPLYVQFAIYLGLLPGTFGPGLLEGNLGSSYTSNLSVATEIAEYLPITLQLITFSFIVAILIAVPLGIVAAMRVGSPADKAVFGYSLFAGAQPDFWWGLFFIFLFYATWHLVPAPLGVLSPQYAVNVITGWPTVDALLTGNLTLIGDSIGHWVLPVLTMAFIVSGPIIKMVRQNVLRALESNYVLYARACGLSELHIALYTFRNAFAPTLTVIGVLYGYMWGGAVLIEKVFSLNGLGQYALNSILAFNYPAIQGVVVVITAGSLITYLVMDFLHALADPRILRAR